MLQSPVAFPVASWSLALVVGLACVMPSVAVAQDVPTLPTGGETAPAPAPAPAPAITFAPDRAIDLSPELRSRVVRVLTRCVLSDLRGLDAPAQSDFLLASLMLREVASLDPSDATPVRRWVEASFGSGEEAMINEATRALIKADPRDTVAQLRLMTSRLNSIQTAGQRMEAYERLLTSQTNVDPSVRSRLALDAALLARDTGDEAKFVAMLKEATKLDSTNKDAAFLAFAYFSQRQDDDKGRLELLSNLLLADPLDASVHLLIRDLMASHGAWDAASRFHTVGLRILMSQDALDTTQRAENLALGIARGTPRESLSSILADLASVREQQRAVFNQQKAGATDVSVLAPEDVRLTVPLEECRIAAAHASNNSDALASAIADLAATTGQSIEVLQDPTRRPEGMDEAMAKEELIASVYRLTMWRMLTGSDLEFASKVAKDLQAEMPEGDQRKVVFDAWVALRAREWAKVSELLAPMIAGTLGQTPDEWALLADALAAEGAGDVAGAAARLRAFGYVQPLTATGAWALHKASVLVPEAPSRLSRDLTQYARTIPNWIDLMVTNPDSFQRLTLQQPQSGEVLATPALSVSLRNLTPVPLALGAGRTINSRVLLGPRVDTPRAFPARLADGEVVELNQRLRLMPGEEVRIAFSPTETSLGWVLDTLSDHATRLRYRGLQGFQIAEDGSRFAPAGNLASDSPTLQLVPHEDSRLDVEALAERVLSASDARIPALLIASRSVITRVGVTDDGATQLEPLVGAWTRKLATLPPLLRVLVLAELPNRVEFEAMAFVDAVAFRDPDPMVQRWNMYLRVSDLRDPTVETLAASPDASVQRIAQLQKTRLEAKLNTFSSTGTLRSSAARGDDARPGQGSRP